MASTQSRGVQLLDSQYASAYVLKTVLNDIPLVTDGATDAVSITCVEFWNDNLYIGTSASEILHLVRLPPENDSEPAQYILASRLEPSGHDVDLGIPSPGVQQILVLPGALKACVLCNGTASFYSLPELSPAFPNRQPTGVHWIGGYDENEGRDDADETAIMIATSKRILQVRVGERLRAIKPNIEYPECLDASRRGTIACVADHRSYALLEIEHQQKIPLFDISTLSERDLRQNDQLSPNTSTTITHGRSKSLGDFSPSLTARTASPARDTLSPPVPPGRIGSPAEREPNSRPSSRPRSSTAEGGSPGANPSFAVARPLKPHVLSPFPNEFMLTTGTAHSEPSMGMFVNLDGDVSRGTIEFDRYPEAVLACTFPDPDLPVGSVEDDQFIVALLEGAKGDPKKKGLQIQSPPSDTISNPQKTWIDIQDHVGNSEHARAGLHLCLSPQRYTFREVAELLQAVRYRPGNVLPQDPRTEATFEQLEQENALFENSTNGSSSPTPEYDAKRSSEELAFVQRLGHTVTQTFVWSNDNLWQLLPNPVLLRFETQILEASARREEDNFINVNVPKLLSFLGSVREHEPRNETDFLSIKYARQKASLILFLHLLNNLGNNSNLKAASKLAENALIESELDPRIPLSLLRPISKEVLYGSTGLWVHQGIVDCLTDYKSAVISFAHAPLEFWMMIRRFLSIWQEKRGASGSLSDEKSIFDSIDAALLHLLLHLDVAVEKSDAMHAPIRSKLYNVVDHWKGDFSRAVSLLEHYGRLFILSRLYQSRKSAKDVLYTWKRICNTQTGQDRDATPEQIYLQMRRYLPQLKDGALVQEYAIWLAQRSPDLGIQVLSDDNSRIKFTPSQVVPLLKEHAPGSVQLFLEHLVFGKNLHNYADDLVGYYLDSVLSVLEQSEQARQSLADSYTTYRALTSPKPTYLNFIIENAPNEAWWQSRLRLLQLLGSGGYAAGRGDSNKGLTYSIEKVLDRLAPFSTYLVSESIILDARQGRHNEALKLLVHGLGDYDTAVRYCYFGGPSSPSGTIDASMLPPRSQQQEQFFVLFTEFLKIEDVEERLERTSHLLGTFATWFDPLTILDTVPETWSVALLSEFLVRTFRAATTERNQAVIVKALSAAQNLQKQADFIEICEKMGAKLELDEIVPVVASRE